MNDIYIITPAENPNAAERNFVLVRLAKNAMRLPTPVDRPAIIVRRNAKSIEFISIFSRLYKMGVTKVRFPETSSFGVKPVSREGTERLVRAACQYALDHHLPSVTLVHKGNIMKFTE